MLRRIAVLSVFTFLVVPFLVKCNGGRAGTHLQRQGLPPVYDFPLYITEGVPGNVWKYQYDRSRTLLASGLQEPIGIATDRFNNLYVVEQGLNRVLQVNVNTGATTVVASGLNVPTVVAVDSTGQAYVAQDGAQNIIRVPDGTVVASFPNSRPSGLAFGVNDLILFGLYDSNQVQWGVNGTTATVNNPTSVSIDATGRVYVAEGSNTGARIWRFNQRDGGNPTVLADTLQGLAGLTVDPVGNIYVIEQGASRVDLISFDGTLYTWVSDTIDPQYLAFTQY